MLIDYELLTLQLKYLCFVEKSITACIHFFQQIQLLKLKEISLHALRPKLKPEKPGRLES